MGQLTGLATTASQRAFGDGEIGIGQGLAKLLTILYTNLDIGLDQRGVDGD